MQTRTQKNAKIKYLQLYKSHKKGNGHRLYGPRLYGTGLGKRGKKKGGVKKKKKRRGKKTKTRGRKAGQRKNMNVSAAARRYAKMKNDLFTIA